MDKPAGLVRVFRHPLVLVSILVLLLNDHVFKTIMPSDLTGKLSDLAGLFFFPFLLGAIFQGLAKLAWPTRRFPSQLVLAASFMLSAAVFMGIKLIPPVNEFMAGMLSALFQLPVRIALDPTDLTAFAVFIPAWMLWARIEQGRRARVPGKLEYAVLGLGALACAATSPCMPVPSIQRLITINDALYARMEPNNPAGFVSRDLGNTWEAVQTIPAGILSDMAEPPSLPLTLCDPADESICFRISGQPWVEGSQDGGTTWRTAWRIPPERESYLMRKNRALGGCGRTPDLIPRDMAFVTQPGGSTLVVAMGNEGVVIHPPSGAWQRVAVSLFIRPTPLAAPNLDQAFQEIGFETILGLAGAVIIYLGLSLWAWIFAVRHAAPNAKRKPGWLFRPARFAVIWIVVLVALPVLNGIIPGSLNFNNYINSVWLFAAVTLPVSILLISLAIWIRAGSLAARPGRFRLYGLAALLAGTGISAVCIGCLLLWVLGVIAMQEIALIIAAAVSVLIIFWVVILMRRGMRLALAGTNGTIPR